MINGLTGGNIKKNSDKIQFS